MTVIGLADQLHDASAIARSGAMKIAESCRLVLRSVDAAERAGFTVGEDFSVTDRHVYNVRAAAARQAQAEGFAADIRAAVVDLVATDEQVASQITAATTRLGRDVFAESGGMSRDHDGTANTDAIEQLRTNMSTGTGPQSASQPAPDTLIGYAATHPAPPADPKEPFSWNPTPADVATGAQAGIAGAAHDYATGKGSKLSAPGDPLLSWTKELEVKGVRIPGWSGAGGLLGVASALPAGVADFAEAKAAGKSTAAAVGEAVAREGAGTAAGLAAGSLFSGIVADAVAGAAIGSVIPGAGTAAGLVAGFVFGGLAAFGVSKGVAWLLSG
jgi:hypothetical protein